MVITEGAMGGYARTKEQASSRIDIASSSAIVFTVATTQYALRHYPVRGHGHNLDQQL